MPGENPIGKRFRFDADRGEWREIIGVVEDGKYRSLGEAPMPAAFEPYAQVWTPETTIVARSPLPEEQVVGMLRRAVAELDPGIAIYGAGSLTEQLGLVLFPARIAATVLARLVCWLWCWRPPGCMAQPPRSNRAERSKTKWASRVQD